MDDDDIRIEKTSTGQEIYVFDPYNPLNKLISKEEIETILRNYGIYEPINNIKLYQRAFVHQSYIKRPQLENKQNNIFIVDQPSECLPLFTKSNERLEYKGDGVLENVTKNYLYCRFPKEEPGFLTDKKIALVKNESIGKMAMEMGLNKWLILSKHAESKQLRTNLKKLGCLFEAFVGAIQLDFDRLRIKDENGWFQNVFLSGPGYQFAQIFIENVFEKHVDLVQLIQNDDNYKNILQVKIQKEFKTTPHYLEGVNCIMDQQRSVNSITNNKDQGADPCVKLSDDDAYYNMGVYLCLGQSIHNMKLTDSISIHHFHSFNEIHEYLILHSKLFIFLGGGKHKIKKKAEQIACQNAIEYLKNF
jgi:dsRNA-specific ribonuclease